MKALVTGGTGFLGSVIVRKLLQRGDTVRVLSRGGLDLVEGAEQVVADIADPEKVTAACEGIDAVFHVASKVGIGGGFDAFHRANVAGARNVIDGCRRHGVPKLVYTSTPSVVFDAEGDEGSDEHTPHARRFLAHYPATKAEGERLVLAANGDTLSTCALRPHLIWGPGDTNLIPRLLARARAGKLVRVGDGKNLVDVVYVDNAADAHLLAADRLAPGSTVAGKAYFITQDEPVNCWEFIGEILRRAGLPPVSRSIPLPVAYAAGALLEGAYALLRRDDEPPMSRFLALSLARPHWFSKEAARRDLDYRPAISLTEGLDRLEAWLRS